MGRSLRPTHCHPLQAKAQADILVMVGDIADADIAPPDNVLFVCKLNAVTTSEDLELIFSRFGKIVSCEVIKDFKTQVKHFRNALCPLPVVQP